jgi:aryl-alcohol dehydrogenase-like predicted oxidoreductase
MVGLSAGIRRLVAAGHRDKLVIISATGLLPLGALLRGACEKNARALGTDYLDVWLVGWLRSRWWLGGRVWPTMQRLKEKGLVRAIGFSCHDRPLAARLVREFGADVLMLRYNAAHRGAEREIFPALGDGRPGIISYTATRWGALLEPLPDKGFAQAMTGPECYRFVLGSPFVDVALCAAADIGQIREDVEGVVAGPLHEERLAEVKRFGEAVHAASRGGSRWMFR